jgi:hypothetical protein
MQQQLDPIMNLRANALERDLLAAVNSVQAIRSNLDFVLLALTTARNSGNVSQVLNLFENIPPAFRDISVSVGSLGASNQRAANTFQGIRADSTRTVLSTLAPSQLSQMSGIRQSLISEIEEAFTRMAPDTSASVLQQVQSNIRANFEDMRTRLNTLQTRTPTEFTRVSTGVRTNRSPIPMPLNRGRGRASSISSSRSSSSTRLMTLSGREGERDRATAIAGDSSDDPSTSLTSSQTSSYSTPTWAIALIVIGVLVLFGVVVTLVQLVRLLRM